MSVLAYAGTRPEDALALEVRHLGKATLLIEQKNVDGTIVAGQKVDRPPRTVDVLAPLREELDELELAARRRAPKALLFPRPDGTPPTTGTGAVASSIRARIAPASGCSRHQCATPASTASADGARRAYSGLTPYDVRHSFASLLIREGTLSLAEIAEQLGNSVTTLSEVYAHVIADMKGQPRVSAADAVCCRRDHAGAREAGPTVIAGATESFWGRPGGSDAVLRGRPRPAGSATDRAGEPKQLAQTTTPFGGKAGVAGASPAEGLASRVLERHQRLRSA